jgi:hypothetical protein
MDARTGDILETEGLGHSPFPPIVERLLSRSVRQASCSTWLHSGPDLAGRRVGSA